MEGHSLDSEHYILSRRTKDLQTCIQSALLSCAKHASGISEYVGMSSKKTKEEQMSFRKGRMKINKVWTTKEGEIKLIEEMDTDHIINCVAFLNRRIESLQYFTHIKAIARDVEECEEAIGVFLDELERRK